MCYPQKCPRCGMTGWAGCGEHVDDVMRSIPPAQRCTCELGFPGDDRQERKQT
ncbi:hypothetical protein EV589_5501 [Mycobacterium sp. BK558]|nr:hypothetical protein EV589_5501 [Mycobacterium sp. BK558]